MNASRSAKISVTRPIVAPYVHAPHQDRRATLSHVHRRALLAVALLCLLPGCTRLKRHLFGARRDQITLERTTFATGDSILVTYSNPLEAAPGEEYWLTLVPAREPDSAWGEWHYVTPGAETD